MALSLSSFSPLSLSGGGGVLVKISGTFVHGHRYRAQIGNTMMSIDPKFYSGVPGQGTVLYPFTAGILRAYSPYLYPSDEVGLPYSVVVTDLETMEQDALVEIVNVYPRLFHDQTYAIRRVLPLHYLTGARDTWLEKSN